MRALLGAVVGYIALFLVLFPILTVAYLALGTEKSFEPESWSPSMLWVVLMLVVGLVAAWVGGLVSRKVGGEKGPLVLAGIVLVLGGLQAAMIATAEPPEGRPEVRPAEVSNQEAMENADTPLWFAIVNPILGVVGVMLGGRKKQPS